MSQENETTTAPSLSPNPCEAGRTLVDDAFQLDEAALRRLVDRFYERVRIDPLLAPVFGAAVHDWDDHLARLADFWSSVMLTSGRYKGNPVALHLLNAGAMTPERFERWLALWTQTSNELLPADIARTIQSKAARIAESLQLAIKFRPASVV